jgi:hypothetical protein
MELMMQFFDADKLEDKLDIIQKMEVLEEIDDHVIDNLAASMDVVIEDGDIHTRTEDLKNCLRMRMKYETARFR